MKYKTKKLIQAISIAVLAAGAGLAFATDPAALVNSEKRDKNVPTVITSDKLDFDYEEIGRASCRERV